MINKEKQPNRLINQKSPYLLQHAHNPIDWNPWGEEAFVKAEQENKPVFISIGYSTCHWCHVMERESFEDQGVADLLNKHFVSIKVDREERPDIDHLYMTYCQALTGAGGWPLTLLLTPQKKPFFAGTYFPRQSQQGRPGLIDILTQTATLWKNEEGKIRKSAQEFQDAVVNHQNKKVKETAQNLLDISSEVKGIEKWAMKVFEDTYKMMEKSFDKQYGGFGNAPKFPSVHSLGFLMRYGENESQHIVEKTLDSMVDGGIYDHIGFGFTRYSTDRYWLVPHFEKMLYDNATIAYAYLEAYQKTRKERYAFTAKEIFEYILRDMSSAEGGFYSAEDADSEGVEGKFYVWSLDEVQKLLKCRLEDKFLHEYLGEYLENNKVLISDTKEKVIEMFCEMYGITREGNYEGNSIPCRLLKNGEMIGRKLGMSFLEIGKIMDYCRNLLFVEREKRIHPFKDDKILMSWNGLMIAALAKGAQVLISDKDSKKYIEQADRAVNFVFDKMCNSEGRFLARFRDGEAEYLAYLDDYAFMIFGLLELYLATGRSKYLDKALGLQEQQERLFGDSKNGGYYFTGSDAEELIIRPKEMYDGAMPSGNSISASNLVKFWKITGEDRWKKLAEQQINAFKADLEEQPFGHTAFLQALQLLISDSEELILAGKLETESMKEMQKTVFGYFKPFLTVVYKEKDTKIPERLNHYSAGEEATAYICKNFACQEPVHTAKELNMIVKSK